MVLTTYTIYKLYKQDCPDFYIGSTFDFKKRQSYHKSDCNNVNSPKYNYRVYEFIRSNGGYDLWNYEILQQFTNDIKVKDELHYIERAYIELLNSTLNRDIPMRTRKEYLQDNKEAIREHQRQYRQDNKEAIREHQIQYYQDNKEELLEYQKQYRQDNKDRLEQYEESRKEYRHQKFNCECGGRYIRGSKAKHFKTRKHQNFINV